MNTGASVVVGPRQSLLQSRVSTITRSLYPSQTSKTAKTGSTAEVKIRKSFQNLFSFGHKYKEPGKITVGKKTHTEGPTLVLGK